MMCYTPAASVSAVLKVCPLKLSVLCLVLCCCLHRFVAISYDVKQKKPELSIAWSGDTLSEKVSQLLQLEFVSI